MLLHALGDRRAPAPEASQALATLPDFCERFLPERVYGVTLLGVTLRRGRAPRYRVRVVRGPTEVLQIVHDGERGLRLARGAGLEVFELQSLRRPTAEEAVRLRRRPPAWTRALMPGR